MVFGGASVIMLHLHEHTHAVRDLNCLHRWTTSFGVKQRVAKVVGWL